MNKLLGTIKNIDIHHSVINKATDSFEEIIFYTLHRNYNYRAKLFIDLKTKKATLTYWLQDKEIKETHSRNKAFIIGYKEVAERFLKKKFKGIVLWSY